ncbi:hypothetical protein [Campylobacter sp. IFREMER_LSEM_CL2194]|uniref:hypothetical protein n=1 Tax=Campylobacter sp. IFREMER_LSEM_CL2194 TaxID=2911621 RepID=UPI0021E8CFF1|nr:hypothetical protein [Campylobacter sp. IFREMER_LSEM_CL2194]MCV3376640.1 hypothetical protein [Campylobacter sp. IFREMER_LSEM_CL2194]
MNQNKIEKLTQHIYKSKEILKEENPSKCWKQIKYIEEIYKNIYYENFDIVYPTIEGEYYPKPSENDYGMIESLQKMIERMEIYLAELKDESEKIKEDKKLININNDIKNNNTNTANATIFQNITIEQALEELNKIPEGILDKNQKEEIENLLLAIDTLKEKDKTKTKEKIFSVLKYLSDKSIDAFISLLPYLGQIAGVVGR